MWHHIYHSLSYLTVIVDDYPFNNPLSTLSSKLHESTQHDSIISSYTMSFIVRRCWKISLTRVWMARWFSSRFGHTTSPPDGMLPKPEPIHAEIGLISLAEVCNFPKQLMNHLTLCTNLVWTGIIWQLLCSDQCYFLPQGPVLYWYSESR